MAKKVSMAYGDKEGKSLSCCCCVPCGCNAGEARYPWNLQISLENDQLEALGIKKLPKVGLTTTITANVKITRCSESTGEGCGTQRSMSLQITDLGLDTDYEESDAMEKAYKGK